MQATLALVGGEEVYCEVLTKQYKNMYYVYILQSEKDQSYYTGYTTDLKKQFKKHNEGGQKYSSQKRPFKLAWYCAFNNQKKATAFEKYLKQGSGFAFARKHLIP